MIISRLEVGMLGFLFRNNFLAVLLGLSFCDIKKEGEIKTFMRIPFSEVLEFSSGYFLNFVSGLYWRTQTSLTMTFSPKIPYLINPGI